MSTTPSDRSPSYPGSGGLGRNLSNRALRRETIMTMLQAALQGADYRFARQCTLTWLAAFPGDLEVALMQAQAIAAEGKPGQVIASLDQMCRKDPLEADIYRVLAQATRLSDPQRCDLANSSIYVLEGIMPEPAPLADWAAPLRLAYTSYLAGHWVEAEAHVQETLSTASDLLLAGVIHLLIHRAAQSKDSVFHLAENYHERWPDCLTISLILAEGLMERGCEPEAVRLLHLCAANDATGRTARRLWGTDHPYRSLWPDDLVIMFDQTIPAGVAMRLGWNQLPQGELRMAAPQAVDPKSLILNAYGDDESVAGPVDEPLPAETAEPEFQPDDAVVPVDALLEASVENETGLSDDSSAGGLVNQPSDGDALAVTQRTTVRKQGGEKGRKSKAKPEGDESTRMVEKELDRLAGKLKQPAVGRMDGRHPLYLIFTSKEGLAAQYGPQTSRVLDGEMRRLAALVGRRPGWGAMVYYPDDATCTAQFGLTPVNPRDPWKMKNALVDLDQALAKRGEMIGALLIVGGDSVVPFHRLPNPTDDADGEVPSDSPYGTLDSNYFVPEWPVGRAPGEKGPDVVLLLEQLRLMIRQHARRRSSKVFLGFDWAAALSGLFERFVPAHKAPTFGYTAAVWRRSSLAVFRPIGAPHTVMASPPVHSGSVDGRRITAANLGYYNLHGLEDSPAWYGQRDPAEKDDCADYPVALTPEDLRRNGHAPKVIFSEACYGGHLFNKCESDSLGLKFLSMGTQAVVGSTTIAYGSVSTPLIAADLLGNLFWQHLKSGRTAGEALMQAKIDLVREMNRRQGFLDGEDQKTLISFVLYGDPLTTYDGFRARGKTMRARIHPKVKLVNDKPEEGSPPPKLTGEALKQVKQIVAEYLPGANLAEMHLARQIVPGNGTATAAAGSVQSKTGLNGAGRVVVTVSKQVKTGHLIHKHYVRVTLDEGGKPVKMSISR